MVFNRKKVEGFNELNTILNEHKDRIIILFTGSKNDGKNWCPDCVQAEPIIEKVIEKIVSSDDTDLTFIECGVGQRTEQVYFFIQNNFHICGKILDLSNFFYNYMLIRMKYFNYPTFNMIIVFNYGNFSWKDQKNAFRTDERFKLKEIPTLMDYNNKAKKLSGEQCANELLVEELFLED
uniref:Thioredoxin domain-containing protein 17 n=1 Tax=Onchocerca volvulus TaxID=6282 RepID=A0A8R1XZ30_ONCVO